MDSCIVLTDILQNMRMGQWRKTCKPWFYTKNNFKNKHCWPFIFSITKTLYILNQCFFAEESVEPFRFRLWPIATALGALILTSRIFFAYRLKLSIYVFSIQGLIAQTTSFIGLRWPQKPLHTRNKTIFGLIFRRGFFTSRKAVWS